MAEVCTTAHSVCHHEPIKKMNRWQEVYTLWQESGWVGVSDSSMGFHLGSILDCAAPRTLIILRDIEEVEVSLRSLGLPQISRYCQILQNRLSMFLGHPLVRTVRFESLRDLEVVEMCLTHLLPGLRIDMDRVEKLMDINIQADFQAMSNELSTRQINLENILGADVVQELFSHV